ncbi:hypothetical protein AVEN_22034-1 [Araneus ventricosus]|uniref:DUF4817 domain-containing protein n=1 Tax=Araneus ventricosus TaxID=182803 RepID=A0A4Y2NY08_ARAVE|nr:hypothetical protein AVEN_22034-1 [Araneus ventricosus]
MQRIFECLFCSKRHENVKAWYEKFHNKNWPDKRTASTRLTAKSAPAWWMDSRTAPLMSLLTSKRFTRISPFVIFNSKACNGPYACDVTFSDTVVCRSNDGGGKNIVPRFARLLHRDSKNGVKKNRVVYLLTEGSDDTGEGNGKQTKDAAEKICFIKFKVL